LATRNQELRKEDKEMIDIAMKNYIIYTINLESIPIFLRVRRIYQAIAYCSGLDVNFPSISEEDLEFYQTDAWKSISKKIMIRDDFTCKICKVKGIKLNVHHIIPRSIGGTEDNSNLITLCKSCHARMPRSKDTTKEIEKLQNGTK